MAELKIDKDLVRELAALLDETGLAEIEWEQEGQRIRVSRAHGASMAPNPTPPTAGAAVTPEAEPPGADVPGAVRSPMVGTVYLALEPGAAPFVKVGGDVVEGQTLFIIEAMKTMNPLPAPRSGRVVQILVGDGAPIEYGEVLLILE
jgi:acetyl-CoA carboxylase biotin carboxyl carrier protein